MGSGLMLFPLKISCYLCQPQQAIKPSSCPQHKCHKKWVESPFWQGKWPRSKWKCKGQTAICSLKRKKKGKRIGCSRESTKTYGDDWKWSNWGTSPTVEKWPGKIKTARVRVREVAAEQFNTFYTSSNCPVNALTANMAARTSSQSTVVSKNASTIMETFQFSRVNDTSTT